MLKLMWNANSTRLEIFGREYFIQACIGDAAREPVNGHKMKALARVPR